MTHSPKCEKGPDCLAPFALLCTKQTPRQTAVKYDTTKDQHDPGTVVHSASPPFPFALIRAKESTTIPTTIAHPPKMRAHMG